MTLHHPRFLPSLHPGLTPCLILGQEQGPGTLVVPGSCQLPASRKILPPEPCLPWGMPCSSRTAITQGYLFCVYRFSPLLASNSPEPQDLEKYHLCATLTMNTQESMWQITFWLSRHDFSRKVIQKPLAFLPPWPPRVSTDSLAVNSRGKTLRNLSAAFFNFC